MMPSRLAAAAAMAASSRLTRKRSAPSREQASSLFPGEVEMTVTCSAGWQGGMQ